MAVEKSLWGIPVLVSEEMPKGEIILGPLPTPEDIRRHGSFENAIRFMARLYAKLRVEDGMSAADEIE